MKNIHVLNMQLLVMGLLVGSPVIAATYEINSDSDVIGEVKYITVQEKQTLFDIALANDMGTQEILEANPGIKENKKLQPGTKLMLPCAYVLPQAPREGIVLNLAERRIYFYHPNSNLVSTFPVGIGRMGWRSPKGTTTVVKKRERPTWTPPESIRAHYENQGKILPDIIPPGPNNPLGNYAMNLGWHGYLIHGTNQPTSVGLRSSSGCIRMYADDIKELFHLSTEGTTVNFVHNPYKIGKVGNKIFLEAHKPLSEIYYHNNENNEEIIMKCIKDACQTTTAAVNWENATNEMKQSAGYPVMIGTMQ